MANFQPLNNYSLFLLDRLIKKYHLKSPFLDVACGNGYLSKRLAKKGWKGKAIDFLPKAIKTTKENLAGFRGIKVEKKTLLQVSGKYNTIFMFDILEHLEDDISALKKVYSLLETGGHLVVAGPSNPSEWRWDDNFYGHIRRYSEKNLKDKLKRAGFTHIVSYDYTFPFFWILRRFYTTLIDKTKGKLFDKEKQTKISSFSYAWDIPLAAKFFDKTTLLWLPIYFLQYAFFKKFTSFGCSMMVLARKDNDLQT